MSLTVLRTATAALVAISAAACAELVVSAPAASPARVAAALLLALVLPGSAASQLMLFDPRTPMARMLLAVGSSVALLIVDSALLYVLGIRLGLSSWAWSLAAVTVACAAASLVGRRSTPAVAAYPVAPGPPPARRMYVAFGGVSAVVVAILLTGTVLITTASVARRGRSDRFTQLWALPVASTSGRVTLGVYNHEGENRRYRVSVSRDGLVLRRIVVRLGSGGRWVATVSGLPTTGRLRVSLTSGAPHAISRWVQVSL